MALENAIRRRILVTGGAGFIGSHLVERLIASGAHVCVLDDLSRGRPEWVMPAAELHQVDIRDTKLVLRVIREYMPDTIVHLAALHYIPAVDNAPELAQAINVGGTRSLLAALDHHPPRRLLFASSAAVYPDTLGPIVEVRPAQPLDLYGNTKLQGEQLTASFAKRHHIVFTIARVFNVIGKRETNPHVVPELVQQLREGATSVRLGNIESRRDYTDVRDVADALCGLLEAPKFDVTTFNIGSGKSVSVRDLVRLCEQVLGRVINIELDRTRRRTHDRAELVADITRITETIGWAPNWALEETLAELLTEVKDPTATHELGTPP